MEESIVHHHLFHLFGTLLYYFLVAAMIFICVSIHLFSLYFSFSSPLQASPFFALIVLIYFFHQVSPFFLASYFFCSPSSLSSISLASNPQQ